MKVLITGGAGFIGSHLVDAFVSDGYDVAVVDRKPKRDFYRKDNTVTYYQCDITDKNELERVFTAFRPDIVDHHAALINVAQALRIPVEYASTNVLGTIYLLELARLYGVKHFLFASSSAVYGKISTFPIAEDGPTLPDSFYGLDKSIAEKYIALYEKSYLTTIFRYANVYGPRQNHIAEGGVVAIFAQALTHDTDVTIFGDGRQTRDFLYVKDVALANLFAVKKGVTGVMNVGTNREASIQELFESLQKISGKKLSAIYGKKRPGDVDRSVLNNQKAYTLLGWNQSYSLQEGLEETYQWFKENEDRIIYAKNK